MTIEIKLDEINMAYGFSLTNDDTHIFDDSNEAILLCAKSWSISQLEEWLPGFSLDSLEMVQNWLANDDIIACAGCLKIWVD